MVDCIACFEVLEEECTVSPALWVQSPRRRNFVGPPQCAVAAGARAELPVHVWAHEVAVSVSDSEAVLPIEKGLGQRAIRAEMSISSPV